MERINLQKAMRDKILIRTTRGKSFEFKYAGL